MRWRRSARQDLPDVDPSRVDTSDHDSSPVDAADVGSSDDEGSPDVSPSNVSPSDVESADVGPSDGEPLSISEALRGDSSDQSLFGDSDDGLDAVDDDPGGVDDLLNATEQIAPDEAPTGAEVVASANRERELAQARRRVVMRALAEDLGDHGDVTTAATVPATVEGTAEVIARADGIVAGLDCLDEVFAQVDGRVIVEHRVRDGDRVVRGDVVATVRGRLRSLLTGERTALNLLCHLSGIASATRRLVDAVEGTGVVIRDTRKTTPGLRLLEKDAVLAGGGTNHRIGLFDELLVKDNHVIAAGGAGPAARAAMERADGRPVQVEISRADQLEEVLDAGVTDILLDNFTPDQVRDLVARTAFRASLEVSGNVTLDTVRSYADTGVDSIAVGAITHSAPWLDLAMDVRQAPGDNVRSAPEEA